MVKRIIDRFPFLYVPVVARSANNKIFRAIISTVKVTAINSLISPRRLLLEAVDTALVRW
jgi:hypothetical protein